MNKRLESIDFLRGIAVILVIFRHTPNLEKLQEYEIVYAPLKFLSQGGWIGVDLFFVLSGYLVSSLIFKEMINNNSFNISRFLIRRGLKIYPAFYFFLFSTLTLQLLFNRDVQFLNLIGELTYLQNYIGHMYPHTWSLAVEEHFYILLSLVSFIFFKYKKYNLYWIISISIIIIFVPLLRHINFVLNTFSFENHIFPTHLRIDSLALGVFISFIKFHNSNYFTKIRLKLKNKYLIIAGTLLLIPNFILSISTWYISVLGLTINSIASGVILIGLMNYEYVKFPKWIVTIGVYSYSNICGILYLATGLNNFYERY